MKDTRHLKELLGKDPPASMEERKQQKEVWDREMAELVEQFSKFKELGQPLTYIRNGLGDWYTCLLYPGLEPTNNLSEQVIREHVLISGKSSVPSSLGRVQSITSTLLPCSQHGDCKERTSTTNCKSYSQISYV